VSARPWVDPDDDAEHPAVDPSYLAATLAERIRQWERNCADWKTTPMEGTPPPWLAQPRPAA
jgi:hypothetical protein